MTITKIKRKNKKNKIKSKDRKERIKYLTKKPNFKNINLEEIKKSFKVKIEVEENN